MGMRNRTHWFGFYERIVMANHVVITVESFLTAHHNTTIHYATPAMIESALLSLLENEGAQHAVNEWRKVRGKTTYYICSYMINIAENLESRSLKCL